MPSAWTRRSPVSFDPRRGRRPARAVVSVVLGAALALGACAKTGDGAVQSPSGSSPSGGSTTAPAPAVVFPGATWATATPAEAGVATDPLARIDAAAEAADSFCVTVIKDGKVVHTKTWGDATPDKPYEVFSASKSFTSTLVGIAQAQGKLRIDEKASTYITEWKGTQSEEVTIKDLLSNDSGRHYDFQTDYVKMAVQAQDKSAFAIGLHQQHPPGTKWVYNNSAIQTLETVLERATGQDMEAFAQANLFGPIGMKATIARDNAGNPLAFMGVRTSCHDLARFGWLFLQRGNWNGTQVVPAAWVDEATHRSQDLNKGYGYLWWLFGTRGNPGGADGSSAQAVGATGTTRPGPTLPAMDAFAALGLGGQIVMVIPDDNTVVVRTGRAKGGSEYALIGTLFVEGHKAATGG